MDEFDIVAIGGGSGSQIATAAADEGHEAAVIEPGPLGGTCITRGCVPSKALIHRADVVDEIRRAERFGVNATLRDVDYADITSSIHETVYAKADAQESSLEDNENVTRYRGEGRFVDERTLEIEPVDGGEPHEIRGDTVVIAVGSRPLRPPIDGLDDVDVLTSDDALYLDERPDDLVVIGGGYIAAELGYFFGALGAEVSIVGRSNRLVSREDEDVSAAVTEGLERHCELHTSYEATAVGEDGNRVTVTAEPTDDEGDTIDLTADELLLATGRQPNTDTLGLEAAGIETDEKGHVETDEFLETTVDGVWALGDVLGDQPYKHAADYEARIVTANVLDGAEQTVDYEALPHAIFTSPRVASVGRTEQELRETGQEYELARVSYDAAPLGLVLKAGEGFIKVLAAPSGEILGCHIVGPQASVLIQEVVVAMDCGGTVDGVANSVHIHPALTEVVYAAFDELSSNPYSTAPDWRDTNRE